MNTLIQPQIEIALTDEQLATISGGWGNDCDHDDRRKHFDCDDRRRRCDFDHDDRRKHFDCDFDCDDWHWLNWY